MVIDTVAGLNNSSNLVPVGARFTVTGHTTVYAVTGANGNEIVTITLTATGGTWTATFGGQTTAALAYNISATNLRLALEALSTIDIGDVAVSGSGPYTIEFQGTFANTDVGAITVNDDSLTLVASVVVEETVKGANGVNEVQTVTLMNAANGTFTLTYDGNTTANIDYDIDAANLETAIEAIPVNSVSVAGANGGPWTVEFQDDLAETDVNMMTGDAALLGANDPANVVTVVHPGATTWELTFSPPIPAGDIPSNNDDIVFTSQEITIKVGEGNLTYTEAKEYEYLLDRGDLDTVREGDEQPLEVSLEFVYEFVSTGTGEEITPVDALKQQGGASGWISSASDLCEPYCVDIKIEHSPPCGNVESEITTLPDFRYESLEFNLNDATISVSGKCNVSEASIMRE